MDKDRQLAKEAWKQMSLSKKIRHFFTYYFKTVLLIAFLVGVPLMLLINILRPHEQTALSVVVFDDLFTDESREDLITDMGTWFQLEDPKNVLTLQDGFSMDTTTDLTRLSVLTAAGDVDVIIASEETFAELAGIGYMRDLEDLLTEEENTEWKSQIFLTNGRDDSSGAEDLLEDGLGKGAEAPYGVSLKGSKRWKQAASYCSDPVMGIAVESENADRAMQFLQELLKSET